MKLSVIIPAFNEEKFLPQLLRSLAAQKINHEYEVIVVDNNSTDKTAKVAQSFGAKVIKEVRKGPAYACNAGFRAATGDILIRIDADTVVEPFWLSKIAKSFEKDPEVIAIGGPVYPLETNWFENIVFYPAMLFWMYVMRITGKGYFLIQVAVRREAFYKVNGYNTTLKVGEDLHFANQLSEIGKIAFNFNTYIHASTRRMRNEGLLSFVFNYSIKNHLLYLFGKLELASFQPIRLEPKQPKKKLGNPLWYLWQLPTSIALVLFIFVNASSPSHPFIPQTFAEGLPTPKISSFPIQKQVTSLKNELSTKIQVEKEKLQTPLK